VAKYIYVNKPLGFELLNHELEQNPLRNIKRPHNCYKEGKIHSIQIYLPNIYWRQYCTKMAFWRICVAGNNKTLLDLHVE